MKKTLILIATIFLTNNNAIAVPLCSDPLEQREVCFSMQNMRVHINMLDAQRDLMQSNYSFLKTIGDNLSVLSLDILSKINSDNPNHNQALKTISMTAANLANAAEKSNPDAMLISNTIRNQCLTCHANKSPDSGIEWGEIFNYDWNAIIKHCNETGRNPYRCKSMNGLLTSISYFTTAFNANAKNYAVAKKSADEIVRILKDLKSNNMLHFAEGTRKEAERVASEISVMAERNDPATFEHALALAPICMKCHDSRMSLNGGGVAPFKFPARSFIDYSAVKN